MEEKNSITVTLDSTIDEIFSGKNDTKPVCNCERVCTKGVSTDEGIEKLLEIFFKVKESLKGCIQIGITGSLALYYNGLVDPIKIKDLDIFVVGLSQDHIKFLQALEKVSPVKNRKSYFNGSSCEMFRFTLDGIEVDVFVEKNIRPVLWTNHLELGSFSISRVMDIVNAKRRHNRDKDFVQLMAIADSIMPVKSFIDRFLSK